MNVHLSHNTYGKHHVRISKIKRHSDDAANHEFIEATINVMLEGDLAEGYTAGNNANIVATDTCKNTVYVLAKDDPFDSIESFGSNLATHFLTQYAHLNQATIEIHQHVWQRIGDCPHGFVGGTNESPTTTIVAHREQSLSVCSGLTDLVVAKTTESGFANFHRDEFRTLPDTDDRIMATSVTAQWNYSSSDIDFNAARDSIRKALLVSFLDHYSHSVQETLMRMGTAAIEACSHVTDITLSLPNKHHILFNLQPFGKENNNDVFVVTDDPFGYIQATVSRD
tara:strand:+ start:148444 stop:149289 length:846 start_codon:yes stop_codon:yes gene_type:complete